MPGAKGAAMTGKEFNIIPTKFVFFKASPDESTVGVVYSLLAGIMGDGAECPGWIPCGAKLDKTRTKFPILKFFLDERRKSPCLKTAASKPMAPPLEGFKTGVSAGRYGNSIIITPEYKPTAAGCRSRGAPGARRVVVSCQSSVVRCLWMGAGATDYESAVGGIQYVALLMGKGDKCRIIVKFSYANPVLHFPGGDINMSHAQYEGR